MWPSQCITKMRGVRLGGHLVPCPVLWSGPDRGLESVSHGFPAVEAS